MLMLDPSRVSSNRPLAARRAGGSPCGVHMSRGLGLCILRAPLRLSCGASWPARHHRPTVQLTAFQKHRGLADFRTSGAYSWDSSAASAAAAGTRLQVPHIARYRMPNRRTATSPPHHTVCCPRKRVRVIPVRRLLLVTACRSLPDEEIRGNLFLALAPAGRLFHLS